jgi:hypothetical protein
VRWLRRPGRCAARRLDVVSVLRCATLRRAGAPLSDPRTDPERCARPATVRAGTLRRLAARAALKVSADAADSVK